MTFIKSTFLVSLAALLTLQPALGLALEPLPSIAEGVKNQCIQEQGSGHTAYCEFAGACADFQNKTNPQECLVQYAQGTLDTSQNPACGLIVYSVLAYCHKWFTNIVAAAQLQDTENKIAQELTNMLRDISNLWQAYAQMRNETFRDN